ncbi:hypothetical protein RCL1_001493 [Eukaryota sp. TZLM3-RCL]
MSYSVNFIVFSLFLCSCVLAQRFLLSRPLNLGYDLPIPRLSDVVHIITVSDHRLLIFSGGRIDGVIYFESFYILSHLEFFSISSPVMFLPSSTCFTQHEFSFNSLDFTTSTVSFVHLKTCVISSASEDIILIAFEFSSSNLNNQYDQLSLKVFSLLNLQESNTFEFIVENDLVSICFDQFYPDQDQSIIANISITHNSDQCTSEFPHEVQFNSIVSCSFCISNTGDTNTSSLQITDTIIEEQAMEIVKCYCSFLKESVPLFLFVSDYKLVVRDVIQRRSLEIATPLSGVRSVDYISSTDSNSLFMVLICNENNCDLRVLNIEFSIDEMISDLNIVGITVGFYHTAVVLADGTVKTWGSGDRGRLGHGNTDSQLLPKSVDGITDAVSVSCGDLYHTLVLRSNGQVLAAGRNDFGLLGDNTTTQRSSFVDVMDLYDVVAISAAELHSLALASDGRVYSWGHNHAGQLGRTPSEDAPNNLPGLVDDLMNVVTIATRSHHSLAVRSDGSVVSWGAGQYGRLGNGGGANHQSIQNCGSFSSAVNVSAGWHHSLILLEGGDLWVTGQNHLGQLGLGDTFNRYSTALQNGYKYTAIAAGGHSSMGVLTNGSLVVWGYNDKSQLGDGGMSFRRTSPLVMDQLSGVYVFDIFSHTRVACRNGTVFGWGDNQYGQIGDGTTESRRTPVRITGLEI